MRRRRPPHPKFDHPALHLLETLANKTSAASFKQLHSHFITSGLALHTYPLSRLLCFSSLPPLCSSLTLSYSFSLLSSFHSPSTFLFNTLISSLSSHSQTPLALSLYSRLLSSSSPTSKPNAHTYPSLLKACGAPQWTPHGLALHAHAVKLDLGRDPFVLSALLSFYCKRRKLPLCRHLFDQIPSPDLPAWNSILSAYSRCSSSSCSDDGDDVDDGVLGPTTKEALVLFHRMMSVSLTKPNEITLVAVVSACGDLGALGQGIWAHVYVIRNGLSVNRFVGTALIEMYSKCGRLDFAEQVFDSLGQKDTMCYNAMIRGLAIHGNGRLAVGLFDRMITEGVGVDEVTMVVVMSACSHAGLVDEGRRFFDRMQDDFGIEPKSEHYGCLVDLLGRAGRLEEAEEVVSEMPMKPNATVYRSLLGACRLRGNLRTGERLLARLMQFEPDHGGNYVLQSNLYANLSRWDDVGRVRKVMKNKGVAKTPGLSLVEMDGVIHGFLIGDKSHPRTDEIYAKLDEIGRRMHERGHRPRTNEVLFDVEEEDKEDALSYHSERLAIAFCLVASDSGPIRIIKNLRVCSDCHSSTKLISSVYGRDIIVRDRTRFHHFKNGACSCLDYW